MESTGLGGSLALSSGVTDTYENAAIIMTFAADWLEHFFLTGLNCRDDPALFPLFPALPCT
jgi:hypothetical protein